MITTMMEVITLSKAGKTNDTDIVEPEFVCELCYKPYQRRTFILPLPTFLL
jgi:hypothetical protein